MFSKKMAMVVGLIIILAINIAFLALQAKNQNPPLGLGRVALSLISPFQKGATGVIKFVRDIWRHYFALVLAAKENDRLNQELKAARERNHRLLETELANRRLRSLLNFRRTTDIPVLAAEVIGRDPSGWFKTVFINKGKNNGVEKGLAVVAAEGIVGQVISVSPNYAKVLLIVDQNSAVDALIQRIRARGVIQGRTSEECVLKYVLRKYELKKGDVVISSGMDQVFPKGLRIGLVSEVRREKAGIFQEVFVKSFVNFEKLEEVLVILPQKQTLATESPEQ